MPHLSSYRLTPSQLDELGNRVVSAALLIRDRQGLKLFFDDLLTTTEKAMLGKRLLIALFLEQGRSYADIGRILKVGETTIAAVSERLRRGGNGFRLVLKKIEKQEKIENVLEKISESFQREWRKLPRQVGRGRWRFLH